MRKHKQQDSILSEEEINNITNDNIVDVVSEKIFDKEFKTKRELNNNIINILRSLPKNTRSNFKKIHDMHTDVIEYKERNKNKTFKDFKKDRKHDPKNS